MRCSVVPASAKCSCHLFFYLASNARFSRRARVQPHSLKHRHPEGATDHVMHEIKGSCCAPKPTLRNPPRSKHSTAIGLNL